jgi:ABC-type transport system involved in multi-copper enzyme maturation permease subunit
MTLAQTCRAMLALTGDSFRQSLAHGIFWLLLGISLLCTLFCLSVRVTGAAVLAAPGDAADFLPNTDPEASDEQKLTQSGVRVVRGTLSLGFGAVQVPLTRDAQTAVQSLELVLAAGVADTLGILLALIWTSGFLPSFLDAGAISVLLTKPTPRWLLLCGKYLGVLVFVVFHGALFLGGTWLALGLRTGVWDARYLLCLPLLVLHFSIFFGFSALLAVLCRSSAICVFGSIAFWCLCWGMNYGRYALAARVFDGSASRFSSTLATLADFGYWVLPKPADLGILLYNLLGAATHFARPAVLETALSQGLFHPGWSIAASLAFTLVLLYAAAREFELADY